MKSLRNLNIPFIIALTALLACDSTTKESSFVPINPTLQRNNLPHFSGIWVRNHDCDEILEIDWHSGKSYSIHMSKGTYMLSDFSITLTAELDSINARLIFDIDSTKSYIYSGETPNELYSTEWGRFIKVITDTTEADGSIINNYETWTLPLNPADNADLPFLSASLFKNGLGLLRIGEGANLYFKYKINGDSLLLSRNIGFFSKTDKELFGVFSKEKDILTILMPPGYFSKEGDLKSNVDTKMVLVKGAK